jgi:hypothetical protein
MRPEKYLELRDKVRLMETGVYSTSINFVDLYG